MEYCLVHISDIHVGEGKHYREKINFCIREINDINPDLIVVTGDLTNEGLFEEYQEAHELLSNIDGKTIFLLGNHDARNVGYLHFKEFFGSPITEFNDKFVNLLALDSSEPDLDVGKIGREYYNRIINFYKKNSSDYKLNIFAIHHHMLPVPLSGRERDLVMDAGDVLKMLIQNNVAITLCGHRHVPNVWQIDKMAVINTGTVASPRTRGINRQSYIIIRFNEELIKVNLKIINGDEKSLALFKRTKENMVKRT